MKYQIEIDSCTELDVAIPKHIESNDDLVEIITEFLNGVLMMLGIKMSVSGCEYHKDTDNYLFKIRHNEKV